MKTKITKFWWGKTTTQTVKLKEYGLRKQIKFYLFGIRGLCFFTINNPIDVPENAEELAMCQIIAERQVNYSEMPQLSNLNFDKFQREMYETFKNN